MISELHKILIKISDFCPPDNTVDLLDESPENSMRLTIAEVGDTARAGLSILEKTNEISQRSKNMANEAL